eukprot:CAMPEP_0194069936 /NCGR_PEP_ID=MMETSP0009_2-20130614/87909_1 /TAXON_ID=210454 /ORGANISM="Grammatophora oceanica, Strain CCMP 410" /LENGTH=105 /DNA_ID=CAMNT_0038723163 /DNA_START=810 /DNA_END=1125 /DNA_ORIENTATION=+
MTTGVFWGSIKRAKSHAPIAGEDEQAEEPEENAVQHVEGGAIDRTEGEMVINESTSMNEIVFDEEQPSIVAAAVEKEKKRNACCIGGIIGEPVCLLIILVIVAIW